MIKFYPKRTVEEQTQRLPNSYRDKYSTTQIDRIEIDGNVITGYMEYSFLEEKGYFEQPTRSLNGSISNINTYTVFFTPRLIIKYNMMNIEDYRTLMRVLSSKNEFTVTCYDPVNDTRVTHKMYAAPSQMPAIYQRYLVALGVQDLSIELIGTNNDVATFTIHYDYNLPDRAYYLDPLESEETVAKNASVVMGQNATHIYEGQVYKVNSAKTLSLMDNNYVFEGWNTKQDGTGFTYIDGDAYFINANITLYAIWREK